MIVHIDQRPLELVDGIGSVVHRYDAIVTDIWGVLHDGVRLYPGVKECLLELKKKGKRIILLSNSARLASEIEEQLARLGLSRELYDRILSSGELTRAALADSSDKRISGLGRKFLLCGPETYKLTEGLDLQRTDDPAQADFLLTIGVNGKPPSLQVSEPILQEAAARKLTMVCANPDLEVVRDGVPYIWAGALAARYEELTGTVIYFGKPYPEIYRRCLELLSEIGRDRIVAVGDSLKTDISGAAASGLDSILVATGIHADKLLQVSDNVSGLSALLKDERFFPTIVAKGLFL